MTDDDLERELRLRPANTATSLAMILRLPRSEIEDGLRRLVRDGRAQVVGTSLAPRDYRGEDVFDPYPAWVC